MKNILIIMLILLATGSTFYVNPAYADIWTDLFGSFTNTHEKLYLDLLKDYDDLASEFDTITSEYDDLYSEYEKLASKHFDISYEYDVLASDYDELYSEYDSLSNDYDELYSEYDSLSNDYDELYSEYDGLYDDYDDIYDDYDDLYVDYDSLWNESHLKTTISGTNVYWDFSDSKGNYYSWTIPIQTYEGYIEDNISHTYQQTHVNPYYLELNGKTTTILNLDGFLQRSFPTVDQIYDNSHSSEDFIYEVWYIVSQMTVYDKDVDERSEGRFAVETFTRTGGDCEDLVILIADMLMSSSHTRNWTFEYIIIDSDNPLNPQEINHVILYVDDGQYNYFIEATAPPNFDYYPDGVSGWDFPVV